VARQREEECTREKVVTGDESNALCTSWAERELQSTEISESFRQQGKKHTISVTATMNKMQPIKPALKYSRGTCAAAFLFFFSFRNFIQPSLSTSCHSQCSVLYSGPNRGLV